MASEWQQLSLDQLPTQNTVGQHHSGARATEVEAAEMVMPRTGTQRLAVLDLIATTGDLGISDADIARRTGIYLYSAAPRRVELLRMGWIEDAGTVSATGRGGNGTRWRLTEIGRRQYKALR